MPRWGEQLWWLPDFAELTLCMHYDLVGRWVERRWAMMTEVSPSTMLREGFAADSSVSVSRWRWLRRE